MSEYCVVVAEGAHARVFTLEPADIPQLQSGPNLVERYQLRDNDLDERSSEYRRGRNRPAYGPGHTYDESGRTREATRKFARRVAREVEKMVRANGFQHLVLCADKRTLGMLRPSLTEAVGEDIRYHEVPKALARLSGIELHQHLAREGHLPRRRRRHAA